MKSECNFRSRSRSNERQKVNIFLDDARELHDIEDDKNQIQRRMKRMHANVSRLIISKQTKTAKKEFLGINEELERILERCDGVQLDPKDENNRKHRKKLIKDTQKLLDRNDKGMSPLNIITIIVYNVIVYNEFFSIIRITILVDLQSYVFPAEILIHSVYFPNIFPFKGFYLYYKQSFRMFRSSKRLLFLSRSKSSLTHVNSVGEARMVSVGDKISTERRALAQGVIKMNPSTIDAILDNSSKKGDVLAVARIAGIQGNREIQRK